jgi:dTDP-4-dehydrorhamnose reductase
MPQGSILITGGNGLLAPFLAQAGQDHGPVELTSRRGGAHPCDLTNIDEVRDLVKTARPGIVIHCAAMTDVDGCERDPDAADLGNRLTSKNLANVLPHDCRLVYISTDQVYPNVSGPHVEGTENPINAYGRSKLAGERAVMTRLNSLALRTSFFGASQTPDRNSLSDFVIENLKAQKDITIFDDVLFSPLHATTLASMVFEIIEHGLTGVYNLASRDGLSKAAFALKIAAHLGLQTDTATVGKSSIQPGRAKRTTDLRMHPGRLEKDLARNMPTLQEEIEKL